MQFGSCFHEAASEIQFFERQEGESVVFPCAVEPAVPPPFAVSLKRKWLRQADVVYKDSEYSPTVGNSDDEHRVSVSGDPSSHSLNVTISELRATDTDRYYCEFVVPDSFSEDKRVQGTTEFFLLVTPGECCIFFTSPTSQLLCSPTGGWFSLPKLQNTTTKTRWAKNSPTFTQQFDTCRACVVWVFPEHRYSHQPHFLKLPCRWSTFSLW